ncbi:MAG: gliding motility lipoprotein GldD [Marinilabiliaceae bacterium]|nr:gliding motility lipoprotein GldD [Marinilabiliaceae bacterium]
MFKILNNKIYTRVIILSFILIFAVCCKYKGTPRPRGYFRIELPEKEYFRLDSVMPYSILYPVYSFIETDISQNAEPFWINIEFPEFKATIHLTYKNLENNDIYELLEDNIKLTFNHTVKADAIVERIFIDDENNVFGTVFEIKGNAASPIQFFATDSVRHFLRGSLYFNTSPNRDSLAPVIDFINDDIVMMMENIRWKKVL